MVRSDKVRRKIYLPVQFKNISDLYNHCAGCFAVMQKFLQDIKRLDPLIYKQVFEEDGFLYGLAANEVVTMHHDCGIVITMIDISNGNAIKGVDCRRRTP